MQNNNKTYIIISIFSLSSLFLIAFFVMPLFQDIAKNSQDLVSAKNDMASLSAQIAETKNFKKNYEAYKPDLQVIDQLFVDPNNPVDFIQFLEGAEHDSQIIAQNSLTPYQPTAQRFMNFQISSEGSFSGALHFLKTIETGPYLVEIENVTIQNPVEPVSGKQSVITDASLRKVDALFTVRVFIK